MAVFLAIARLALLMTVEGKLLSLSNCWRSNGC